MVVIQIKKILIGHDGSSFGAGWFLDEVSVNDLTRGGKYTFVFNRWFDKKEDDGKIERELSPTSFVEDSKKSMFHSNNKVDKRDSKKLEYPII